jgi:hypothetical protein
MLDPTFEDRGGSDALSAGACNNQKLQRPSEGKLVVDLALVKAGIDLQGT